MKVIDVSEHNGVIDWDKVKGHCDAVIIRLGYRGYGASGRLVCDKQYATNRRACEARGIPFSLYFFPQAVTVAEAEEEARFIVAACKGMSFPLPVFLDSEYSNGGKGRADRLDRAARTHMLRVTAEACQAAGIPIGIYASTSWLQNRLDMSKLPYSVWCAQYAKRCTYKGVYVLWQYTSRAIVPGISGYCDMSVLVAAQTAPESKPTTCPYKEPEVLLRRGDAGGAVRWVQWQLVRHGYSLAVDGQFGPKTEKAVLAFQIKHSLSPDGIVGPKTRAALKS